ncbi:hypothetical protein R3P38DRAFT_2771698 [Favolaschia claudopus]|uniref:Uncharacterized protein n=1 Tax=Favolaschia claudopus TaxID=2862362 RepID=A0AAW0CAM8_9AGAR
MPGLKCHALHEGSSYSNPVLLTGCRIALPGFVSDINNFIQALGLMFAESDDERTISLLTLPVVHQRGQCGTLSGDASPSSAYLRTVPSSLAAVSSACLRSRTAYDVEQPKIQNAEATHPADALVHHRSRPQAILFVSPGVRLEIPRSSNAATSIHIDLINANSHPSTSHPIPSVGVECAQAVCSLPGAELALGIQLMVSAEIRLAPDSALWADRALAAAAGLFPVIYVYDVILTFPSEVDFYGGKPRIRTLAMFVPLRYIPLLYQLAVVVALIYDEWTGDVRGSIFFNVGVDKSEFFLLQQSCSNFDAIVLALDSAFQMCYVSVISFRVKVISNWMIAVGIALLGYSPPILSIAVANPSAFARCRILSSSPTARVSQALNQPKVLFVPCMRSVFDACAALLLLWKFWQHWKMETLRRSALISFLITEEIKDIILIFGIMAMEAVFIQIPSARTHARNFIVPFVDSMTASLATRFILELHERGRLEKEDTLTIFKSSKSDSLRSSVGSSIPHVFEPDIASPLRKEAGSSMQFAPMLTHLQKTKPDVVDSTRTLNRAWYRIWSVDIDPPTYREREECSAFPSCRLP